MSQIIYQNNGGATLACFNGHVIIPKLPEDRFPELSAVVAEFQNTLADATKPSKPKLIQFLESKGFTRVDHNGHDAFALPSPPVVEKPEAAQPPAKGRNVAKSKRPAV